MKRKLRLRKWVKVVLVIIAVIGIGSVLHKLDEDYMNGCMSAGYSETYCIANK